MFPSLFRHCYRHRCKQLKHTELEALGERSDDKSLICTHMYAYIYTHENIYIIAR